MPEPSRGLQISRRCWLLASLVAPLFPARGAADPLIVTFDGDNLHVSSLGLHFLQGKSLSRLKGGSTVEYVVTVSLFRDQFVTQFKRAEGHFLVSYDVWGAGDVFAVSTPGPPPRKAANLSQSATETWCLESMGVAAVGIAPDRQFWLQLDLRALPPKLSSVLGESKISVDLIEVLTPGADERQTSRTGPLRLADLVRTPRKGRAG
jgi:hypothetical protein